MFSSRCDQAVHGEIKIGKFAVLWKHFLTCQLVLITFYTSDSYAIYMDRYGLMSATYISKPNLNFYIPIYILLTSYWEGGVNSNNTHVDGHYSKPWKVIWSPPFVWASTGFPVLWMTITAFQLTIMPSKWVYLFWYGQCRYINFRCLKPICAFRDSW